MNEGHSPHSRERICAAASQEWCYAATPGTGLAEGRFTPAEATSGNLPSRADEAPPHAEETHEHDAESSA
jgi:hypothetical protein